MNKICILTLKIIPLAILLIITSTGCSLLGTKTDAEEISKLKNEIDELTDGDFKVPLPEDYPLLYAYLRKPPVDIENGPYFITLQYSFKGGDVGNGYQEDVIGGVEYSQGISILYGPYDGTTSITIEYSPIFKDAEVSGVDEIGSWTINGQEMEYYYIAWEGKEVISVHLNLDKGGTNVTYFLSDKFNKEDAKSFTAYLVGEMD